MSSIIGFGEVGQALARAFTRKGMDMNVASRRAPDALAPQGALVQARGNSWAPLVFQDLVKPD
jgi:predicted dinucleotide-binding enzyme